MISNSIFFISVLQFISAKIYHPSMLHILLTQAQTMLAIPNERIAQYDERSTRLCPVRIPTS